MAWSLFNSRNARADRAETNSLVDVLARRPWLGYLFALAAVVTAFLVRQLLMPVTGHGAPWVLFFAAVTVTSIYAGTKPALAATLLAAPLGTYAFSPHEDFTLGSAGIHTILFVIDGLIVVYLSSRITTAKQRAEERGARLQEEDRRKNEFLAMLSHELRNPLSALRSSSDVLGRAPSGGETALRAQAIMTRQVEQLTRIIDDLLDVSRISRGKLQLKREPLRIGDLIRAVVDDHRIVYGGREIALEATGTDEALWVDGDAARIAQVIGNLLHNAAKFTPRGGRVDVSLARDAGDVVVRVRDTGVGVPAESLPRLFEPFMQIQTPGGGMEGGLGLGLALVKGLTEMHGGSVAATSAGRGLGFEVAVRLPLAEAPASIAEVARVEPEPAFRAKRVLVIDDNQDAATALADVLGLLGHEVRLAFDGPRGLAAAREFHPDVVLCDLGMPGMDGYEVARSLHADAGLRGTRLVALTGFGQPEDVRRSAEAGFTRHVVKPVSLKVLEQVLDPGGVDAPLSRSGT